MKLIYYSWEIRIILMLDHVKFCMSQSFECPESRGRQTYRWSFNFMICHLILHDGRPWKYLFNLFEYRVSFMEDQIPIRPDRSLLLGRQTSKWSLLGVFFHENDSKRNFYLVFAIYEKCSSMRLPLTVGQWKLPINTASGCWDIASIILLTGSISQPSPLAIKFDTKLSFEGSFTQKIAKTRNKMHIFYYFFFSFVKYFSYH